MTQTAAQSPQDTIAGRFRARARVFTERVDGVPEGRWDDPSPCAGWSARDVLGHMVDNCRTMPGHVGLTMNLTRSVPDDPRGAWAEARDAMQELLDDPRSAGLEYDGYFGRTSLQDTVDRFLGVDLIVHAWDIARATGQDEELPADECRRFYDAMLPFESSLRMDGVCGPAVEVPADAPVRDRLLGLMGRTP